MATESSGLDYYPIFTHFQDNHGNSHSGLEEDRATVYNLVRDTNLRPGDRIEVRVIAQDPRGRDMSIRFGPSRSTTSQDPQTHQRKTVTSGEEAVFTWEVEEKDVSHAFRARLTSIGSEYHRSKQNYDQELFLSYTVLPPEGY